MGQKRALLPTIRIDAAQTGVSTAFSPNRMPETMMRKMAGAFVDFRGVIRKLPKRSNQSGPLRENTSINLNEDEAVSLLDSPNTADWDESTMLGTGIKSYITTDKILNAVITDPTTASNFKYWERLPKVDKDEEFSTSTNYEVYCSFQFRASHLPETPSGTNGEISVYFATMAARRYSVALCRDGLYIETGLGVWTLATSWGDINVLDGSAHTVEVWIDPIAGTYAAGIDGVVETTTGTAYYAGPVAYFFRVWLSSETGMGTDEVHTVSLWNFLLRDDTDTPAVAAHAVDMISREGTARRRHHNFIATKNIVWVERKNSGRWRPLIHLKHSNVMFFAFKERIIVIDKGSSGATWLYEIEEDLSIRVLDDAPNIRVGATHLSRVWGFGDRFDLRLYFSAPGMPNVWFAPETDADGEESYSEATTAGFLTIQGEPGERPRAIVPNYYGLLLIVTDRATYKVQQVGESFGIFRVTGTFNAFSQHSVARVGNDVWSVGPSGVGSLQTTDKFGDLVASKMSLPIQDIFTDVGRLPKYINTAQEDKVSLVYNPQNGLVYLHFSGLGSTEPNILWIYNTSTEKWYGPHQLLGTCMRLLRTGSPRQESVVIGTINGEMQQFTTYEEPSDSVLIQTANLDGRSISPELSAMDKTWKYARLYYNPLGDSEYLLKWRVPGKMWEEFSFTMGNSVDTIEEDFTIGLSAIGSTEDISIVEIPLDVKGKTLEVELYSDSPPSLGLHLLEFDFSHDGYERG